MTYITAKLAQLAVIQIRLMVRFAHLKDRTYNARFAAQGQSQQPTSLRSSTAATTTPLTSFHIQRLALLRTEASRKENSNIYIKEERKEEQNRAGRKEEQEENQERSTTDKW